MLPETQVRWGDAKSLSESRVLFFMRPRVRAFLEKCLTQNRDSKRDNIVKRAMYYRRRSSSCLNIALFSTKTQFFNSTETSPGYKRSLQCNRTLKAHKLENLFKHLTEKLMPHKARRVICKPLPQQSAKGSNACINSNERFLSLLQLISEIAGVRPEKEKLLQGGFRLELRSKTGI